MKKLLARYQNSRLNTLISEHEKYVAFAFFAGGFIFDTVTIGRIDRLADLIVLCLYMLGLTLALYCYNLADDGTWKNTLLGQVETYLPLAIQFLFGGLSSAFVVYFARSVSLTKTMSFFLILIVVLIANEFLRKRISNKYFQFGLYFFINFTFFSIIIPVFTKTTNPTIFLVSGLVSLTITLLFISWIYWKSPSTRAETHLLRLVGMIISIYLIINTFYYFKLIPPVPLALQTGIIAHDVQKIDGKYVVTYEADEWYIFWREHRSRFRYRPGEKVYAFTSVFAPTEINKAIFHRWKWYDAARGEWQVMDDIGFKIKGGRDDGYRGYTYKSNVIAGQWEVELVTEEELVLGAIKFEIVAGKTRPGKLVKRTF